MNVLSEIILRMQANSSDALDMQGIVLIDELETHLHIQLQKKILPFLTDFFPKLQFIVTTHSPFVISSVSNAIVCDLEKRIVTEDLSGYSYEAIVESYFDSDKYSQHLKDKLERYEHLVLNGSLSEPECRQKIAKHLDRSAHFTAFKRWIIRDNEEMNAEFGRMID